MDMTARSAAQAKQALKTLKPLCGDCSGLKCEKLIEKQKGVCSKNGKTAASATCPHFMPDVDPMRGLVGTDSFEALVTLIANIPNDALRSVSTLLYNEKKTRNQGFRFGQKVYVRYRGNAGSNYMSNFMQAYIMGVFGEYIRVMSKDGKCVATFMLDNQEKQIYSTDSFDEMRKRMIAKGKLVDPDVTKALTKRFRCVEEYELGMAKESYSGMVTTIDTVFKESKIGRKRKGSTTVDLVEIVDGMMNGHDMSKIAKQYKRKVSKTDSVVDVSGV